MTEAEAKWRTKRTQQLLAQGLERFDALARCGKRPKTSPGWAKEKQHDPTSTPHPHPQALRKLRRASPQSALGGQKPALRALKEDKRCKR